MSAKRFTSPGVMIVLLSISLFGGGCATTSSQNAQYKPHKPQMITAHGPEEVGASKVEDTFDNGLKLSDNWAYTLTVMGPVIEFLGRLLACH
jgi:hypothetical protein